MKLVLSGNGFPFLHKNVGTREYYNEYVVLSFLCCIIKGLFPKNVFEL